MNYHYILLITLSTYSFLLSSMDEAIEFSRYSSDSQDSTEIPRLAVPYNQPNAPQSCFKKFCNFLCPNPWYTENSTAARAVVSTIGGISTCLAGTGKGLYCSLVCLGNDNDDPCTPSFIGCDHNKTGTIFALVTTGIMLVGTGMMLGSALPCCCCCCCKKEN